METPPLWLGTISIIKHHANNLCLDIRESTKQTYLGGTPPNMPPWVSRRHLLLSPAVPAYIKPPHCEYGGVFGGVPPKYVRFDPPLKSYHI